MSAATVLLCFSLICVSARAEDQLAIEQIPVNECDLLASGVLKFVDARDHGKTSQQAFDAITQGNVIMVKGSIWDQMEVWAYTYPQYQPEAVAAYAYGDCVLPN
ncbi:MAG TPA: hypothetical protein VGN70_01790 [Gammaproteobacteria bacterium]|jgi:hypothetical protein